MFNSLLIINIKMHYELSKELKVASSSKNKRRCPNENKMVSFRWCNQPVILFYKGKRGECLRFK
jgi:hypothetical protein